MHKFNRFIWWFWVYLIRIGGSATLITPLKLPVGEGQKLKNACLDCDVLVVFNPGGWGDASLEEADDFRPILKGIQQAMVDKGYRTSSVPYLRTFPHLWGRLSGVKEQIMSFKNNSRIQVDDIRNLAENFPEKYFILTGFSTGGGLTGRSMKRLAHLQNVLGITVGVPGWFDTYSSSQSLVLNNSGKDPLVAGDINAVAWHVLSAPYVWLQSRFDGRKLSLPLCFQFPYHEYRWESPEVGPPILKFISNKFRRKDSHP
jgi:hypothetical protein